MLCLTNITKKYKEKLALDDVSLELAPGMYGLLGPNGAGKSTLMNIVTGNLKPDGGQVLWDGKEIKSLGAQYRSIIGYAPQQQGLYDAFTGKRFLAYMATLKGISKKEMPEEIARVLSYPEKFWKIANQYYRTRKVWDSGKNYEKLQKEIRQNQARGEFLAVLKQEL